MPDYTIDATGLQTPRFPEARALVVARWKSKFGENAQTASDTPDGLLIDVLSLLVTLLWEAVAGVYAAQYFRTAAGIALDYVLDKFARSRIAASSSTASAVFYGDTASAVTSAIASVADTARRFAADADGTTVGDGDGGPMVVRVVNAVDGNTYAIDVDTTTESTVVAPADSTNASIADLLAVELAADNPSATVNRAGLNPAGDAIIVLEDLGAGVVTVGGSADVSADQAVDYGVRLAMTAELTGPLTALAGTLNTLEVSLSGIRGVCNTADATPGRNRETDPEYRARHLDRLGSGGAASAPKIRARVLERVLDDNGDPHVEYCQVFQNLTADVDSDGRPAHSFETVWIGTAGTAVEALVAAEILEAGPAGILPYGSITTEVTDAGGQVREIGHSRGTELLAWLTIVVTPGEGYPAVGDPLAAIETAVVEYLTIGDGQLGLGDDLLRYRLATPINAAVPGVANAVITTGVGATEPAYTAADLEVDGDEILRFDSARVTVTL